MKAPLGLALLAVLACAPAYAAGTIVLPEAALAPNASTAACATGETRATSTNIGGFVANGQTYYTLLDPADCSCTALEYSIAWLRVRTFSAGTLTVRVRIVGAAGPASCPRPDTTVSHCGPTIATIAVVAGTPAHDYPVVLPPGCCVVGKAFLAIDIVAMSWAYPEPFLATPGGGPACLPCRQWVGAMTPSGPSAIVDICSATQGLGYNVKFWADASCCGATPTQRPTWGRLKVGYR